jgi:hypothetical protein
MVTDLALNMTRQPASHNLPIESKEAVVRAGTMWTGCAKSGRLERSSSASCVEYMMEPLGSAMAIGRVMGRLLMTAADTVQKCAVLPLSAMAMVESGGMTVGGTNWTRR